MPEPLLFRLIRYPIIVAISMVLWPLTGISQETYYWFHNRKIPLTVSDGYSGIEIRRNDQSTLDRINAKGLKIHGHFGNEGRSVIVSSSTENVGARISELRTEGRVVRTFDGFEAESVPGVRDRMIAFDELLVKFHSNINQTEISNLLDIYNMTLVSVNDRGVYRFRTSNPSSSRTIHTANQLYEDGFAEWSEPIFAMQIRPHEDSLYVRQWYLLNLGQIANSTPLIDIRAPHVWWGGTLGDSSVIVAVLDDGVESHDDLPSSRLLTGWTAAWGGGTGTPSTGDAHGQAVAGIIAASHNDIGVRGVAPGVKILPIKIFSNGGWAGTDNVVHAIDTARSRGAHILSMSWGCGNSEAIEDALMFAYDSGRGGKGCVLIASGGNSQVTEFPANIDSVIAVGGVNMRNNAPWYAPADYGVDVVAPTSGCESLECVAEEEGGLHLCEGCYPDSAIVTLDRMGSAGYNSTNYMMTFGGTSAAAPQVSGVAALMISFDSTLTSHEIRYRIRQTATNIGSTNWDGEGRLNARSALGSIGATVAPYIWPDTLEIERAEHSVIVAEPKRLLIFKNYPNPFNPSTSISVEIDRPREIDLTIYDLTGKHITTIKSGVVDAGFHAFEWNASEVPSGVYFCRLRSENTTLVEKILVTK